MTLLVVGLSHKSAPVGTLERAAIGGDELDKLRRDVLHAEHVAGTFIVSTCNRVEIYAEVDKFHGGVSSISELLARHSGIPLAELTPHLYVHYEDRAVQHLLDVTCGLDSMVVGESQILGQVRQALGLAREQETLGRELGELGTLALRTGKRAHAETGIDRAGANLVSVGIGLAAARLPGAPRDAAEQPADVRAAAERAAGEAPLSGRRVLLVGAGSMSALAAATASRMGAAALVVANRTPDNAERLAATLGGTVTELAGLPEAMRTADLVDLLHRRGRSRDHRGGAGRGHGAAGRHAAGAAGSGDAAGRRARRRGAARGEPDRPGRDRRRAGSRPARPPPARTWPRSGPSSPRSSPPGRRPSGRPA